jgi:LPS O-antigen subunit length determinant protein (WzzB/FepE family)
MEAIIVALIGVVGSVLVVLVEKGRKENARDHGIVAEKLQNVQFMLENIDDDVMHIEFKLDNHLSDHSKFGGFDIDDLKFKTGEKVKDKKHGSKKR